MSAPEAILLIGVQACGKSTFARERFFDSHVRINLDMLRNRRREETLLEACLATQTSFVVDNTNPAPEDRARYIERARAERFTVAGYYFQSNIQDVLARNAAREGKARIPEAGVLSTYGRLQLPRLSEGFDALYYVRMTDDGFDVQEWQDDDGDDSDDSDDGDDGDAGATE